MHEVTLDDMNEEEWMNNLQGCGIEQLKMLARCCSRWINNKMHGNPLYGIHYQPTEIVDVKVKYDIEQTITVDEVYDCMKKLKKLPAFPLDCCEPTQAPISKAWQVFPSGALMPVDCSTLTKEHNMYAYDNTDATARRHLKDRICEVNWSKQRELEKTFNQDNQYPKNAKQAKEWLAKGAFSIQTVFGDDEDCACFDYIWSNPDAPRNDEGYKAAKLLLGKDYQTAKDAIVVLPVADGLKALQEFEAKVYN